MDRKQVIQDLQKLQALARSLNQNLADFSEGELAALTGVLPDLAPLFRKFRYANVHTGELVDRSHQTYIETELRRLLGENRRQEALLDAIFAADPSGLAVVEGPELRFVYANPAYRYICPYLGKDPVGVPYELVWPADSGGGFHAQIKSVLETGRPFQALGFERVFPDGSKRIFTVQSRRIQWDNEPAALLICWDTTDLTLSQRQLLNLLEQTHHQAEEMRGLFNAMHDAVIIYDVDGEVLHANPTLIRMIGFDPTGLNREAIAEKMITRWPDGRLIQTDKLPSVRALNGEDVQGERIWLTNSAGRMYMVEMTVSLLYSISDPEVDPSVLGVVVVWHDITERFEAEQSTAVQQAWFRTALSSIGDAVITTDGEGKVTFLNPVAEQLTGWSSIEAAGQLLKQVFNIINEQTRQPAENPVGKVLEHGLIVGLANHTSLISRYGQEIPIEDSAAPIKDAEGNILGVVMVFYDVTEERKADLTLRESEDKYRTVADFTYDWEYWIAPDDTFRYVSPSCERITGYPSSAFMADSNLLLKITHPEDRQKLAHHLQEEMSGSQMVESIDFRVVTSGGEERWLNHVCQPVFDRNGQWAGRRASNRDITDRMLYEAERERLLAENLNQRAFLAAQSFVDPGGQAVVSGEDLIICSANPAYRALTPHPEKDPLGQPYREIWPPEEGFTQEEIIRQAIRDGKDVHHQRHPRHMPDGQTRFYTFHIHPIEWEGQQAAYLVLWDITELIQTEEALKNSEAALRSNEAALRQQNRLIELSYEPIFTWTLEGEILTWNEGCEHLYGYTQAEAVGRNVHELLQTCHPIPLAEIKEQLLTRGLWTGELHHRTKDRREIIIESRKQLIETDGQQMILETNRDVTERRQFEERLAAEREWLRITLSSIGDAVITTDAQGNVSFLNPVAERLTGWASAEAAGQPMEQFFHIVNEQTRQPAVNPIVHVLREGVIVGLANHTALIDRYGRETPIEDSAAPIKDSSGKILGVVMVFRDVTGKRRTEQELHESRALLQAILDGTPDLIFLKDRDSRILLANSATLKLIGKPPELVIGKNDSQFYEDPAVGLAIMANDRQVMELGQTQVIEERVVKPNEPPENERIYLSTKTPYRDAEGQVIGIIGVSHDITKQKEEEREHNQLNRTLQALNKSNQMMMRSTDELAFMQEACRIITEDCGYAMVWIGFAERDAAKTVRPVAYGGFDAGYLKLLNITWADTERGQGPTGIAIRSGQPSMCRNILTEPRFAPWREEAVKRGYASSLVLPMLDAGKAFGAITVYSNKPDAFSEDEVKLLSELASDLSYGILTMRVRAAHTQAEQALRVSEERYRSLFHGMTEGFALHEIVCDEAGIPSDYRFLDLNPAFERLTGLTLADVKGKLKSQVAQLQGDDPKWVEIYGKVALTREPIHFENYSIALQRHYEVFAYSPAPLQFAVIFMDITERKEAEEALRQAREMAEKNRTQIEVQHHLIEQREQERQQIARDLHDGPVQIVTGVTFTLQSLIGANPDPQLKRELDGIRTSLQEVLGDLRAYAMDLRPPVLFNFGLRRAIQAHMENFQEKHPELHTQLKVDWVGELLPEQVSIALFRIYQESLNNIVKHAGATEIWVQLVREEQQISLVIEDNGSGFTIPTELLHLAREGHLGLVGMRERAEAIGGNLEVVSHPGKGTRIQVQVSLD